MTDYVVGRASTLHACNCVGPKNGQPLCPCAMRNVTVRDGHYVRIQDLGPVRPTVKRETREEEIARLKKRIEELGGDA